MLLCSCEGRITPKNSLDRAIVDFKENNRIEELTYIPSDLYSQQVDTSLSSGYEVNLKIYSDTQGVLELEEVKEGLNHKRIYRHFWFELSISKNDRVLITENFVKTKIDRLIATRLNFEKTKLENLAQSVLHGIQVNQQLSLKDTIYLDLTFKNVVSGDLIYVLLEISTQEVNTINVIQPTTC